MADSSRTIMTDAGFALETRVRADKTKMQFTRAAISTDDHFSDTDDALAKLTELSNIQQDGKVTAVQVINTTTVYVQVDVNQAESKADYQMRSAALYAKDDDGTEVLYGVTVLQDPVFVHKDADGSYLGFGINTTVGKASNVVVVVDPANMVTQQVFEGTMKNYYTKAEVDAKFVTDDDFASKLPKNIATTDAANTFAKSQTLAGGATDGKGNAYVTAKDAKTTAEKYADDLTQGVQLNSGTDLYTLLDGENSYYANSNSTAASMVNSPTTSAFTLNTRTISEGSGDGDKNWKITALSIRDLTGKQWHAVTATNGTGEQQIDVPWTLDPSDDTQLVHKEDMRKPASDVAGIEEVNAKQDKIGYTPADDSKVVHTTDTSNWQKQAMFNQNDFCMDITTAQVDFATLLRTKYNTPGVIYVRENNGPGYAKYIDTVVICEGNSWWYSYGVTKYSDFVYRKISQDSDTGWIINADDSKVAHLSGANNFDTVPTVKNNPLLLASSLPSDLARLSQDANFTAKLQQNGQDVALANNTIARNPNTGVVSEPVDFTKLTVNGGKSVATSDDLKSLATKAWGKLEFGNDCDLNGALLGGSYIIYHINEDEKYIEFFYKGKGKSVNKTFPSGGVLMDLSSIVKGISRLDFTASPSEISDNHGKSVGFAVNDGTKIIVTSNNDIIYVTLDKFISLEPFNHDQRRIYYTELA